MSDPTTADPPTPARRAVAFPREIPDNLRDLDGLGLAIARSLRESA